MIKQIIVAFLFLSSFTAFSQSNYSNYGIGEILPNGFADNISVANAFIASNDSLSVNLINPASLSNLRFTTFNLGVSSSLVNTKTSISDGASSSTAFQNFALSLPMANRKWGTWGMSFGLKPYSKIATQTQASSVNSFAGNVITTYKNTGDINSFYLSNGFGYKNFSAGVTANFLFGDSKKLTSSDYQDDNSYSSQQFTTTSYKSINLEYGLQYVKNLKTDKAFGLGVVFTNQSNMRAATNFIESTYSEFFEVIFDTLSNTNSSYTFLIPSKINTGLFYQANSKLKLGASISSQNWSTFKSNVPNNALKNNSIFALGAEYQPNYQDYKSYFNRVKYRLGFRYSDGMIEIDKTAVTDYGITFGFELPVRGGTRVNIGAELGKRGTTSNGLFEEKYAKLYIGFTFNDKWFNRIQYD